MLHKISDLIKNLEYIKEKHGDLPCYYSTDDEGNSYKPVFFEPSIGNYYGGEFADLDDNDDNINAVCIN